MNKQTLTIIRGLPGSGKSTLAKTMCMHSMLSNVPCMHFEADQYFEDDNGNYNFDATKLGAAHTSCMHNTEESVKHGFNVIVANTFTTLKEVRPYHELAQKYGIDFIIVDATGNYGSIHNVPTDAMKRMQDRWISTAEIYNLL